MKKIILFALPALFFLAGCSSSKVTTSWVSNDLNTRQQFNKILVMGLLSNKNRASNVSMENNLVADLRSKGIQAVASTDIYGPKAFDKMNENEAMNKMESSGIDGVITITMIDKNKKQQYVNNYVGGPYSWWGYYSYWSPFMWSGMGPWGPGYVRNYSAYTFETNLYNLSNSKQLVYSAHSETTDPSSAGSLGKDYAKSIVEDMVKKGVL